MVPIGQMLVFAMLTLTPSAHLEADLEMHEPGWPPTPRELPASASGVLSEIKGVLHQEGLVAGSSARVNARMHSELSVAFPSSLGPTMRVRPYSDGLPTSATPTNKTPPRHSYRPT